MEHDEQTAVIHWARLQANIWPALQWLHAIPNGARLPWRKNSNGKRYSPEAAKLKAEGLTPGVPDLFLPFAAHGYHGFYIEMKAPGKLDTVRDGQSAFMAWAESVGYLAQVHDSAESAIEALKWYLT
jgi:hypothetical protein